MQRFLLWCSLPSTKVLCTSIYILKLKGRSIDSTRVVVVVVVVNVVVNLSARLPFGIRASDTLRLHSASASAQLCRIPNLQHICSTRGRQHSVNIRPKLHKFVNSAISQSGNTGNYTQTPIQVHSYCTNPYHFNRRVVLAKFWDQIERLQSSKDCV